MKNILVRHLVFWGKLLGAIFALTFVWMIIQSLGWFSIAVFATMLLIYWVLFEV